MSVSVQARSELSKASRVDRHVKLKESLLSAVVSSHKIRGNRCIQNQQESAWNDTRRDEKLSEVSDHDLLLSTKFAQKCCSG